MHLLKSNPTLLFISLVIFSNMLPSCSDSSAGQIPPTAAPPAMPVLSVVESSATVYQEYTASLEGSKDIEIRPQVEGTIERIYVDEGASVRKGQSLFKINDRIYREQLNNSKAVLAAARANLSNAQINVSKITPLVQNNIISDVQLQSAKAAYNAAFAQVAQAQAMVRNAEINLSYTNIKAPSDGFIGRIPYKTGSLAGTANPEPLTILSEIKTVYTYFSLSENDFIRFGQQYPGNTTAEKIASVAAVELQLADGTIYPLRGKLQLVSGQFNNATGSISFRAVFPNPEGRLRSGNTGKVRLPLTLTSRAVIPQEASFELQDKLFVFQVGDSNKVKSIPITISARSGKYYLIEKGLKPGDKIVFSGLDRLQDGTKILPQLISMDSILKTNPL